MKRSEVRQITNQLRRIGNSLAKNRPTRNISTYSAFSKAKRLVLQAIDCLSDINDHEYFGEVQDLIVILEKFVNECPVDV